MNILTRFFLFITAISLSAINTFAQGEHTAPLYENILLQHAITNHHPGTASRPTALSLPIFEDFTNSDVYPDEALWQDKEVWINNNMAAGMVSRGVATFDALSSEGVPYDTLDAYNTRYADSLTSQTIDLSAYTPDDSLYLSFFYQPQGNGFAPGHQDSLMLYLHTDNGVWQKVWDVNGSNLDSFVVNTGDSFRQVMIPIADTHYLYESFQFRFVNKATIGITNPVWNVDYIRMDANRSIHDTAIDEVAFTTQPPAMLNDFTYMPYKHFATGPATFLNTELQCTFRNNGSNGGLVNYGYDATFNNGDAVSSNTGGVGGIAAGTSVSPTFPMYSFTATADSFTIENKYYLTDIYPGGQKANDTIVQQQYFSNYFAYDDGTAEQSYFLSLANNVPGKIAIENKMYVSDTLRGVAIQLVRQVPTASQKYFSLAVYKTLAGINGANTDSIIYQQDFYYPKYSGNPGELPVYAFDSPVIMDTGTYYIAMIMPANGPSDSLMIALDVNRHNSAHRYYSVYNQWQTSLLDGALMMRPIVGKALPVAVIQPEKNDINWSLYPNPVDDAIQVHIHTAAGSFDYTILDATGRIVQHDVLKGTNNYIAGSKLSAGIYYFILKDKRGGSHTKKFIKK